jgi:hypothetical protein
MGFDSKASTGFLGKARINPAIKRVAEKHLDDAIAYPRFRRPAVGGSGSATPPGAPQEE